MMEPVQAPKKDSGLTELSDGLLAAQAAVLSRGRHLVGSTPMSGPYTANALWGWELREKIAGGEPFFVLDLRDRADYEKGHIPGARHLRFSEWASPESLSALPIDEKIAVICETGDRASQAVAGLRLLGFDAFSVKTGIHGWAESEESGRLAKVIKTAKSVVERTRPEHIWPEPGEPGPFEAPSDEEFGLIAPAAASVMRATPPQGDFTGNIISPATLDLRLAEGSGEDLFLLDLRREEDYEGVGHIPGALQMNFESSLSEEALALLPTGKKIVTICYTGNLAAQMTMVLRLLGYDAAVLACGMICWSRTPTAFHYLKDLQSANGELVADAR